MKLTKYLKHVFLASAFLLAGCAEDGIDHKTLYDHYLNIAKRARETNNPEAALNLYKKAKDINPDDPRVYLGIATVHIDMKLLDAALKDLKMAESRGANRNELAYLRGKVHLLFGNLKKAKVEFQKADTPDCLNALGSMYDGEGNHEEAQRIYKRVIEKNPNYIEAYNNLGLSLLISRKYKDAVFYLENACSFPNTNSTCRNNLALAYGMCGQMGKARQVYSKDYEGEELEEKMARLEDMIARKKR